MNIYNEFRKTAINRYSKTALVMMNDEGETKEYTFGQTLQQADVFCSRLKAMGVVAGDRVCVASEGRPEWNIAFLACAKLNATAVLLDYSLPAAELVALVKKSQPVCVVASQKAAKKLTSVKNIPVLDIQNQLDRLDGSGENILRQGEVGDPDIAVIIFSSGTTRTASGIMHTHDSQINSCKMVCRCNGITDNERYLGILPNSHIYGLFAQVLAPLLTGGTVCFIESLSAKGLSAGFQNFKPTVFPGVPKVYELLKTQIMQQINGGKVSSALFKKSCWSLRWNCAQSAAKNNMAISKSRSRTRPMKSWMNSKSCQRWQHIIPSGMACETRWRATIKTGPGSTIHFLSRKNFARSRTPSFRKRSVCGSR